MSETTPTPLIAFHGQPERKAFYVARLKRHRDRDEIIRGQGWLPAEHRGCLIGCSLHRYDHQNYEGEMGIPASIAMLADAIFENMSKSDCYGYPLAVTEAAEPGQDFTLLTPRFLRAMLSDPEIGVRDKAEPQGQAAIDGVLVLFDALLGGNPPELAAWSAAWSAARSAAESAASSAAWSAASSSARLAARLAAESAAWSAARSAASSAASSAAESAAWSAAWSAAFDRMAAILIDCIRSSPMAGPAPILAAQESAPPMPVAEPWEELALA